MSDSEVHSADSFGALLRQRRLASDLTQLVLAERAGLSVRAIQHLEADRGQPYAETSRRLADALGLAGAERLEFEARGRRSARPRRSDGASPRDTASMPPHNLPRYLTSFVGRASATAAVRDLVRSARLTTLVGAGGCGKTRLAIEAASGLVPDYPDGVWLVELAPLTDSSRVADQIASVLDLPQMPRQTALDVVVNACRSRRMLLLLDNCEHVLAACASVARTLVAGCPDVQLLATSREVLGVAGETIWRVPSLSSPEAVSLFIERAVAAAPGFELSDANAATVQRICARLDRIPLALELAAARVRTLGVAEVAARLDDCFRLLAGSDTSRPPRQQTLEAAIDWSYGLLTADEQQLLAQLSVFSGTFSLEAVESVCWAQSDAQVADVVERLVDRSLVIAEPRPDGSMRYRLLETLRQYAARRLAGQDSEAVAARHAHYFSTLLTRWWQPIWWGPNLRARLNHVEDELDNLRAALRWLMHADDLEAALSLGYALGPFWLMSARVSEGRAWLAELSARAEVVPEVTAERAGAQAWLGGLLTQDGDLAGARAPLDKALAWARECGDALAEAFALMWFGIWASLSQQHDLARTYAEEGLAVSRAGGYRALEGLNLRVLAQTALDAGDLERAWALAEQGLAAGRDAEHPPSIAWALNALGLIAFLRGNYAAAQNLLRQGLEQGHRMVALAIQQSTLAYLCWAYLEQGELEPAAGYATQALSTASGIMGGHGALCLSLEAFAQLAAASSQPELALRFAAAAQTRREAFRVPSPPSQRDQLERWLKQARASVGPELAQAALLEGSLLTDEQVVSQARALL